MPRIREPLSGVERRNAFRRIERASSIVRNGSFMVIPFMPLFACCPLGPVVFISLIVPLIFFRLIHSYFADAAEDIYQRHPRPLFIAITVAGLLVVVTLLALFAMSIAMKRAAGGTDRYMVLVLPGALVGFSVWMLVSFVRAWNALQRLRIDRTLGFEVIVAPTATVADAEDPSAIPTAQSAQPTLPPRPNLGPRNPRPRE